jgi:hypothetical protein
MRKILFVLPGYCAGLGGLVLITYRTLLALGTESKSVTIQVNRFGEQYLDVICLVFLWSVCVIGVLSLSSVVKDRSAVKRFDKDGIRENSGKEPYVSGGGMPLSFLDEPSGVVVGVFGEPFTKTGQVFSSVDIEGTSTDFSYSVQVVQDTIEE